MQFGRHAAHAAAASSLQRARQITVVLFLLTAVLSFTSVSYLGQIVGSRRMSESAADQAHADWHGVLSRVEHNLESHLPHQVADELALLGVGQRPQGAAKVPFDAVCCGISSWRCAFVLLM